MDQDPNHERKIFIGGLAPNTTSQSLRQYFTNSGTVTDAIVMMDPNTQRSRGFGFVTFEEPTAVTKVLAALPHIIDGKATDVKKIVPKSERVKSNTSPSSEPLQTNKIFVGGLKGNLGETEMQGYFQQFGPVSKVDMFTDPNTGKMKGFCFVTFEQTDSVDSCFAKCTGSFDGKTEIKGVRVEVKRAKVPDKTNRVGPQGRGFFPNMSGPNQGFNQGFQQQQGGFQQGGFQQNGFQGAMGMQGQMGMPQNQMGMQGQMGMAQGQMQQNQMGMQPHQNQLGAQPGQMGMQGVQQTGMMPQGMVQQPAVGVQAGGFQQPAQQGYAQQPQQYSQSQANTAQQPQQGAVGQTMAPVQQQQQQQFGQQAASGYNNAATPYAAGDQQWGSGGAQSQSGYDQSGQYGAIKAGHSGGYNSARQQAAPY